MSIESLKQKARKAEQKEDWQKALEHYNKALTELAKDEQVDIGLYNRVGDLYVRVGRLEPAVEHYEKAVELYREAYLPNNAIAVCKKIIRNVPNHHRAYLVIGQIRAEQGFLPDARTNFLTYAERMQAAGDLDESFRALIEFCDLAPEDVGVRVTVAEQMAAQGRTDEAVEQLTIVHRHHAQLDEDAQADEIEKKIRELDPDADLTVVAAGGFGETALDDDFGGFGEISLGGDAFGSDDTEATFAVNDAMEDAASELEAAAAELADAVAGSESAESMEIEAEVDAGLEDFEIQAGDAGEDSDEAAFGFQEDEGEAVELPMMSFDDDDGAENDSIGFGDDESDSVGFADDAESDSVGFADHGESDSVGFADDGEDEEAVELPMMSFDDETSTAELPTMGFEDDEGAVATTGFVDASGPDADVGEAASPDEDAAVEAASSSEGVADALQDAVEEARADDATEEFLVEPEVDATPAATDSSQELQEAAHDFAASEPVAETPAEPEVESASEPTAEVAPSPESEAAPQPDPAESAPTPPEEVAAPSSEAGDGGYVDLGAMILGGSSEKSTRFTVAYEEPSGDEEADFAKMLSQFKDKVSENLDSSDVRAHYDLGTAYKEMGLLDEAITSFQAALRASANHLPTYEMMGQTFIEMGQPEAAVRSLERALDAADTVEDELVGIYYYLGRAYEALEKKDSAVDYYDRVFALDINFADVTERLRELR